MKVARGIALLIGSIALLAVCAWAARLTQSTWHSFPPAEPVAAWTLVVAVGSVMTGLGTVALSAFALRGLRSLRLTRQEMLNRATKEGKLEAIHRLEEVAREIIPLNEPILDGLAAGKVQVFLKVGGTVRFNPDPTDLASFRAWVVALPPGLYSKIVGFLNRLEAWSVYFTAGVADDTEAFGPVAPLLRSWVGQYYPVLVVMRASRASGAFPNLIKLYTAWSARMDAQQLEKLHDELVAQMDRKQSQLEQGKLPGVIGSKVD
jgi:hypothetical protein